MKPNPILKIVLLSAALFAFGLSGCSSPKSLLSRPPKIDAAEAARHLDAPSLGGSGSKSCGSSSSSGPS